MSSILLHPFLIAQANRWILRPIAGFLVLAFTLTQIVPAWAQTPLQNREEDRGDQVSLLLAQAGFQGQHQELQQRVMLAQAVQSQAVPRASRILINHTMPQNVGDIPPESAGEGGLVRVSRVLEQDQIQPQTHTVSLKVGWNLLTLPGGRI